VDSPILSSAQMRETEEAAFAGGVTAETLMEHAGAGIARFVRCLFPAPGRCIVFAGKGHNGGDALTAARYLKHAGWSIDLRLVCPEDDCSPLTRKQAEALRETPGPDAKWATPDCIVILDGLLGLGSQSLLREPVRTHAKEINRLRKAQNAFVFAIDLPTGLNGDTGETDPEDCVIADFTVTIGCAKHGLILDNSLDIVGRIEVVPLLDLVAPESGVNDTLACPASLQSLLPRRAFSAYKNQFGRIGILAGSEGTLGAAIMATEGALRAGGGLVELFVPKDLYPLLAPMAPAESMVRPFRSIKDLIEQPVDVWAIGPGLGTDRAPDILRMIDQSPRPMVVDADAINVLGEKRDMLKRTPAPRLLTPHPGEMKRLFDAGKMSRAGTARNFCEQYPVTLLLKGSRTIVAERAKPLSYNSTGNPGMATGGMGDVLTGVCAGLAGRGLGFYDAGRIGAWACGRAAEIAVFGGGASEESLLPRDVLAHLGTAFNELREPIV
jgi:ADP-dependent NAD(P)H-hydrate dehydratase / NAD(P)H-hydrate epimerase